MKTQSYDTISRNWLLYAFVALLVLASSHLVAQKTIVYGSVFDVETNEPLPFVNVAFQGSKVGTTTDLDGNFRIETYYAEDSLVASFIGYKPKAFRVVKDKSQEINFALQEGSVSLKEVVVNAKDFENPAHILLKKIIKNKKVNNREKLDSYEYETYNKIEFDLNNLSEKFTERKLFQSFDFIFDNIDSTGEKVSLPFFMTESISDYYYNRSPKGRKEIIHATKVSGINNESISQFLGQMYQDVNIYQNSLAIFGKNFVSPISDYGLVFYKYYLVDSAYIDNKWCYRLDFLPKNETELVFEGHFWVNDTTYAIKEVDANILPSANINFIEDLHVRHEYDEVEPEVWMLKREVLLADFSLVKSEMGFYGKKVTTYKDFVINEPKDKEFYSGAEHVIVKTEINAMEEDFWVENRHEVISDEQQAIYDMVDSLKTNKVFMTYVDIVNFLVQGYWVDGKIEYGPIFTFLSYNAVEGLRPKFGLRTSNEFSKRLLLEGYVAYGTKDERFKYMFGGQYFISKKPRQVIGAYFMDDYELIGQVPNYFSRDHFIQILTVRNPQDRLILNKQARIYTNRTWFSGFSTLLEFRRREMASKGSWNFEKEDLVGGETIIRDVTNIISTEVSLGVRFAYRENFVEGEFERISLGSYWPIVNVRMDFGLKGVLDSEYEYQKLTLSATDKIPFGPFGTMKYSLEGGKTWQPLPYPLQFVHSGNESFFYNSDAFNTMNFFEFVSDRYIWLRAEHHFEGFFFNKIPLFKRLKWREIVGLNGIYGAFNDANIEEMLLPDLTYTFDDGPFAEAYLGIDNIFRFFRVDAIWRLTYLDNPNVPRFGLLLGFDIKF
ncbi:MAG: DUF5686 and carboxypeptidase regulatory-like domain-containing protein [Flavobacteriales bacterium]|nr:DUF5686 and carboxypeptidase regulatory-like domain-containing protein [Flavobacteriales bacterium]